LGKTKSNKIPSDATNRLTSEKAGTIVQATASVTPKKVETGVDNKKKNLII
jgi:hypothetical protein